MRLASISSTRPSARRRSFAMARIIGPKRGPAQRADVYNRGDAVRVRPIVTHQSPDDPARRQPVHVVYGGAHLFTADAMHKLGALSRQALEEYAPDAAGLAAAFELPPALAERIYPRLAAKLAGEPVEDFRIDFEDGFGQRSDDEEDRVAKSAAEEVARGMEQGTLPAAIGIRIKNLGDELKSRSLRTFDLFLSTLLARTGGVLP